MANDLARWQFATTSIYHFFFVPVTIGLAFLVAILQTAWYRTEDPEYKRMTRFFGTLLLINVAIGVVTGLVQEFEFGMNWSTYSRFVGGVFGAPLAMEGLAAFFLESTFLGLWLFGWDRLPKRIHLACIWAVSIGSMLSAMFILMANSWMQHPVGYRIDRAGNAQLKNIWAVFVNPTFVWGYAHVILASLVTGSLVMLAVSAWYLRRREHVVPFQRTAKVALVVLIPTIVIQLSVGNQLGVIETRYQPAKIAAAEALWNSCKPCSFSAAQLGGYSQRHENPTKIIQIPHLLSVLATGTWSGPVTGLNQLQAQDQKKYGPGNYIPNVAIQYWSMRTMAGLGTLVMLFALWGGWLLYRGRLHSSRVFLWLSVWLVITPFLMNTAGWMLTESGRQPWIVQGLQKTVNANSPAVSATDIWISLSAFVLAYIVLAAADLGLMLRYSRRGLAAADAEAAFPGWYATMFSALYLALLLVLLALFARGVSFEYRGKRETARWRAGWSWALAVGSALIPLLVGVGLGDLLHGLPINQQHDFTGNFFDLLTGYGLMTGVTLLTLCLLHGATFMALRTTGEMRDRARAAGRRIGIVAIVVNLAWVIWTLVVIGGGTVPQPTQIFGLIAVIFAQQLARTNYDGWAFAASAFGIAAAIGQMFIALYPNVMVSSTNHAYNLTVNNSAAGHYSLVVMTVVAVLIMPIVLLYQGWSFHVFRRRVSAPSA